MKISMVPVVLPFMLFLHVFLPVSKKLHRVGIEEIRREENERGANKMKRTFEMSVDFVNNSGEFLESGC